ncbi:YdeI/OmpD-associated family protein [Chryseobacterium vrystaatense]|uniref:Bacteriocin-protection, YdeI or OmpD-Associated n=1 Tax=Chryseobacterium vrystaatense TaxID=307480 RepID=A0A1M4UY32_9FLAO|nr:YdeI/OmpD-associated family protein [Chryseobacterium vrystaatense]SHE61582.1 Bacteriocin-protection, YdeI or OmpD-Associated [Chryseobacterium vrystaatense]
MMKPIEFTAVIQKNGEMNAAFVEFPFSTEKLFNKKGQVKIRATFDHKVDYRGSLVKMNSDCHILGLTQEVRKQLGKSVGDEVSVSLIEDMEERRVEIADDIASVFTENPDAKSLFDKMSYTHRKEYIRWIEGAKKPETREKRKVRMIEMILKGKKGI